VLFGDFDEVGEVIEDVLAGEDAAVVEGEGHCAVICMCVLFGEGIVIDGRVSIVVGLGNDWGLR
jgi:hypothetical protein